jgi:hypothetical protein
LTFVDPGARAVDGLAWREATLIRREAQVAAREAALAERAEEIHSILVAADERDAISGARDAEADQRDREHDLAELLDVDGTYGEHWAERRSAILDRWHARGDRAASRKDRLALSRCLLEQDL